VAGALLPNILISYRRDDSDAIAGRIRDRIASIYGDDAVFMDIDSIPFGLDFRRQVIDALIKNDVVLAIIGPKWTGPLRGGALRIRDETDPVRIEIETALSRGIPLIPVLVGKAVMPKVADLPPTLSDLAYINAAEISAGRDFNQHIERLLRSIELLLQKDSHAVAPPKDSSAAPSAPHAPIVEAPGRTPAVLLLERCGVIFTNREVEHALLDSFRTRYYWLGQTAMMFGIVAWLVFGATDLLSGTAGLPSIQFRFMLAMPLMVVLFGLSFAPFARAHWQIFFAIFAVVGITCMYVALILVGPTSWFRVEQATMSFMLFIAFVGLAPFTTLYTLGVGLFILALHALYLASNPQLDMIHQVFYSLFVAASYAVACTAAWVRERFLRSDFIARSQVSRRST
jgi:TIR domain